jgi:molybdopterin-guanine dinucleotide biosynthesis protein A
VAAPTFTGVVLTGGASRRMGRDKATLLLAGMPMAERVAAALATAGAERVLRVPGDVADERPGAGPLGGIVAGLDASATDAVVVLACDLLAPDPRAIADVVAALGAADVAVAMADGRPQWLHAAWARRVGSVLRARLDDGVRAIHRAVEDLTVVEVDGLPSAALADADRPADLPAELPE